MYCILENKTLESLENVSLDLATLSFKLHWKNPRYIEKSKNRTSVLPCVVTGPGMNRMFSRLNVGTDS